MQKLFVKSSSIIVGKFTRIDYPTSIPPKLIGNLYHALPRQGGYTVRPKKITAPKYQHASNIPSVYEIDLPIIDLFIFQLRKDTIIMQDINFLIPNTPHNYPDVFKHDLGSKIFPYLSINVLMIWYAGIQFECIMEYILCHNYWDNVRSNTQSVNKKVTGCKCLESHAVCVD